MDAENDQLDPAYTLDTNVLLALIRTLRAIESEAWANVDDCLCRIRGRAQELLERGASPDAVASYLQSKGVPVIARQIERWAAPHAPSDGEVPEWWEIVAPGDPQGVRELLESITGMSTGTAMAPRYRLALTPTEGRRLRASVPHLRVGPVSDLTD